MDKIRNLSVRKTIVLYMTVSLVCSFFLSALVTYSASKIQEKVWWKYTDEEKYFEMMQGEGDGYVAGVPRPAHSEMTRWDNLVSEICDFLQTYSILLLSILGSCMAVFLFYRNKLKIPIDELKMASKNIAKNNLDFCVTYENRDEMGQLCQEFERMRKQLAENNQKLWRMIEEEKVLRAAIAHDIRTPLSVLKGYQEMLLEFVPEETMDKQQILSMLSESMRQIERINEFIETMRRMNSLENRELRAEDIDLLLFAGQVDQEINLLCKKVSKKYKIQTEFQEPVFIGDRGLILEVIENLLSNALRYAKETVNIVIMQTAKELTITITDDGQGFLESPDKVTKAFFHANPQDDPGHFGLGMYICRLYCEKHGGKLLLGNQQDGGAIVKAAFKSIE